MNEQFQHLSEEKLQAMLDNALDPTELQEIEAHIQECSTCHQRLDRAQRLSHRLQDLPQFTLSRDLSQLVVSQLREERQLSRGVTWTLVFEALAVGAVIGLLIPTLQAAGWLPRLLNTRQEILAAVNIFFTQLASTWLVWGAELRLQISQLLQEILPLTNQTLAPISPWILIGTAGGLGMIINYLLLGRHSYPGRNHD
jgi:anti-sigma factor RsiW